ncbi:MAG: ATP-grasp domain-containing protein [Candidatus Omnitrophica bacterium]|nr:ATP-grasp domain-containing protein [Candidatus Omnitrophota bacterium]
MITKIGITYNLKSDFSEKEAVSSEHCEEFDNENTINAICEVFNRNGYQAVKLGFDLEMIKKIKNEKVDFVFNIAEGCRGRNREAHIPCLLEMLDVPYSGSDPLTLGLTLDKTMTKKIALQAKIPTPRYTIITSTKEIWKIDKKLNYPLIIKPAWEGSSKGIYNSSRVYSEPELKKNLTCLLESYSQQPILIEEYIEGREITAGVIGNNPAQLLGIMEITHKNSYDDDFFYSLETKRDWKNLVNYVSPPDIEQSLAEHIRQYALLAFKEFGCRDIARIDFKISNDNKIFLLELNPLPGLSPEYADLVIMAKKNGIEYEKLILSILNCGLERYSTLNKEIRFDLRIH